MSCAYLFEEFLHSFMSMFSVFFSFYNEILFIYLVLFPLYLYFLSMLLIFLVVGGGLDRGTHSVDLQPDFVCVVCVCVGGGWGGGRETMRV